MHRTPLGALKVYAALAQCPCDCSYCLHCTCTVSACVHLQCSTHMHGAVHVTIVVMSAFTYCRCPVKYTKHVRFILCTRSISDCINIAHYTPTLHFHCALIIHSGIVKNLYRGLHVHCAQVRVQTVCTGGALSIYDCTYSVQCISNVHRWVHCQFTL